LRARRAAHLGPILSIDHRATASAGACASGAIVGMKPLAREAA
jgi:hypothetical protein